MASTNPLGQVITFYSYKGGTGRSMALANVACLLAKRYVSNEDEKVLMIDWDLEAPGLHRFFEDSLRRSHSAQKLDNQPGLIDLFMHIHTALQADEECAETSADRLFDKINLEEFIISTGISSLDLLKAGRFDEKYAAKVNAFRWEELHAKVPWLFRTMAERLTKHYKYVLIDSRTGMSDISGICTTLMPEKVVVVFTPNRQSLTGVLDLVLQATDYRKKSDDLRPLIVFPLPSRVEVAERTLYETWRLGSSDRNIPGYQHLFEDRFKDVYNVLECDLEAYFDDVQIQHVAHYAYGEEIAVLVEQSKDSLSLTRSYDNLTECLVNLETPWDLQSVETSITNSRARGSDVVSGGVDIGRDIFGRDKIVQNTYNNYTSYQRRRAELPNQPYFFGREEELTEIANALDPESNGWGVLIDGPGGVGKTALAIRAGHFASDKTYPTKIFLSAKVRELTPQGEQDLEDFTLPNFMALITDLAKELGEEDIERIDPNERVKAVRRALENSHALIIIDNLETFDEKERDRIFQFLKRLPRSCKAIVTSRRRTDVAAKIIRLERLKKQDAFNLIAKLAERNTILARTSERERQSLYEVTKGNPLLIEWTAGQLGRTESKCRTINDACKYLESAPGDNDPLEFIFGDLLDTFTDQEIEVLATLTYFTQPAKDSWIADLVGLDLLRTQIVLEALTDRSLLISHTQAQTFMLSPLAAQYIRRKRSDIVTQTAKRLTDRIYALVLENGYGNYERLKDLEIEWPSIAATLPLLVQGDNARLQTVCDALKNFLNFTGRWDERLSLNLQAEDKAVAARDWFNAGWRAYEAGWVYYLRQQSAEVLACADRAAAHWRMAKAEAREVSIALQLRGIGHELDKNYPAALTAYHEALALRRNVSAESADVANTLSSIADVESYMGDYAAAERDYREALRVAKKVNYREGVALHTGNLAVLALDRKDWRGAEQWVREALPLCEAIGRQELIASSCDVLAESLAQQGRKSEGLPFSRRAVAIYTQLKSPSLASALATLKKCGG